MSLLHGPFVSIVLLISLSCVTGFSYHSTSASINPLTNLFPKPITYSRPVQTNAVNSNHLDKSSDEMIITPGIGDGCKLPSPSLINTYDTPVQASIFVGIFGLLYLGSWLIASGLELIESSSLIGGLYHSWQQTWAPVFGILFTLIGVTHFTLKAEFANIYPYQGAWGIWYIPGSPSFHVLWTGVAESLGGLWLLTASILSLMDIPIPDPNLWFISSTSAASLAIMMLIILVTPANIFSYTHGAKLPMNGPPVPLSFHYVRGAIQCLLVAMFYELARPSIPPLLALIHS